MRDLQSGKTYSEAFNSLRALESSNSANRTYSGDDGQGYGQIVCVAILDISFTATEIKVLLAACTSWEYRLRYQAHTEFQTLSCAVGQPIIPHSAMVR